MDRNSRHSLIKRLQTSLPRGAPFDVATLGKLGISAKAAAHYAKEGWIERIGQGVYAFPADPLDSFGMVQLLQTRVEGLHIGGRSALALHGVGHNLRHQETLTLWGDERFTLPAWFTTRQPGRYVSATLFEWPDSKLAATTITTPPGAPKGLRVSVPERAALELFYETGTNESLEEAKMVFEGMRNFRPELAGRLLSCCTSVKAVRLFLTWARETELVDVNQLRERYSLRVGSSRRWISRLRDGTVLTLRPYG